MRIYVYHYSLFDHRKEISRMSYIRFFLFQYCNGTNYVKLQNDMHQPVWMSGEQRYTFCMKSPTPKNVPPGMQCLRLNIGDSKTQLCELCIGRA